MRLPQFECEKKQMNNPERNHDLLAKLKQEIESAGGDSLTKAETGRGWLIAWVCFYAYIASVLAITYLMVGGDTHAEMPRTVFFSFCPVFCFLAVKSHMTGVAPGKFMDADRVKEPTSFWMLLIFYWFGAAACFVIGLGALLGFWK